ESGASSTPKVRASCSASPLPTSTSKPSTDSARYPRPLLPMAFRAACYSHGPELERDDAMDEFDLSPDEVQRIGRLAADAVAGHRRDLLSHPVLGKGGGDAARFDE